MKEISTTRKLMESAIMLALATVLSLFKLVELPYGGSVTFASMLPIIVIAYRYGVGWGLVTGLVYGGIQQLLGLHSLSYVTTWQSTLAVILLDYVIAFGMLGFGGAFRKMESQPSGFFFGTLLASLLRYICHVISGATVWAGLSIPTGAALTYSLIYNATYMVPETIVLLLVGVYLSNMLDFRQKDITAYERKERSGRPVLRWIAGLILTCALVFVTVVVFGNMQNPETGEFDITGLNNVNWKPSIIVGAGSVAVSAVLIVLSYIGAKKAEDGEKKA